ncbi:MAG: hypothetical protein IIC46_13930, partial [Planctomycetes bacterium]|nr:hypothetical protein [Planctomycetota bacterium]
MIGPFEAPSRAPRASAKPIVAVTMGDPCGIGAEVIVKALADPEIRALGRFIVYGIDEVLTGAADQGLQRALADVPLQDAARNSLTVQLAGPAG